MTNPATAPILGYDGDLDPLDQQEWLDIAWRALQGEIPGLQTRIDTGDLDAAAVADVVTAAARRALRNPDGAEASTLKLDDYSEAVKFRDSSDDIYFTRAELRRLRVADADDKPSWSGSVTYC